MAPSSVANLVFGGTAGGYDVYRVPGFGRLTGRAGGADASRLAVNGFTRTLRVYPPRNEAVAAVQG